VIQCAIAVFKLGDLTRYISESVVIGFMAGAGFLIAVGQIGNLFGLRAQGSGQLHVMHRLWLTVTQGGPLNPRALAIGLGTVGLIVVMRRFTRKHRLPRVDLLLALILAAGVAALLGWTHPGEDGNSLLAVIGRVPRDLPLPHLPEIERQWVKEMAGSAVAVACLGLLEAVAIAKAIGHKTRQSLDYNKQCLAEGLANLVGGFFRCLPGSGSLTRSAINYQAGAVSRLSGVFAAAGVALALVLLAPLAWYLPRSALAGLLLVTAAGLIDWPRLFYAWNASRYDAGLILATALSCVFISVEFSILIGVTLSILMFVPRAARLKINELAVNSERVVRERQPSDLPCSALVVLDLEGELFFGAAPELERCFEDLRRRIKAGARIIVLRVKRTRNPDMVCMELLQRFLREMEEQRIKVLLCGVREDFAQAMKNLHFQDSLPAERIFLEKSGEDSSTVEAVRRAYELLGADVCASCPRRGMAASDKKDWYYMI